MRTSTETVTFTRPFTLPGFEHPHAAGSFEIKVDEEQLDTSFDAWRRTGTRILLVDGGLTQAWPVEPHDLKKALLRDSQEDIAR